MHVMDISERVNSASELSRLRQNGNSEMTRTQDLCMCNDQDISTGREDIIWVTKKMKTHIEICWTITEIALWVYSYNLCLASLWRLCQLFCKSSLFKFNCLCSCRVCMSMCRGGHVHATCGGKRANGRGWFSPSTLWTPGMSSRPPGLYCRTLNN